MSKIQGVIKINYISRLNKTKHWLFFTDNEIHGRNFNHVMNYSCYRRTKCLWVKLPDDLHEWIKRFNIIKYLLSKSCPVASTQSQLKCIRNIYKRKALAFLWENAKKRYFHKENNRYKLIIANMMKFIEVSISQNSIRKKL